jgi:hypothetical protein
MYDLNFIRSLSFEDFLIIYLARYFNNTDIARGLSVTPPAITNRFKRISHFLDVSRDPDGRINYEIHLKAKDILDQITDTSILLADIKERTKKKRKEYSSIGFLGKDI